MIEVIGKMDIFLYNGDIKRGADLQFINMVAAEKSHDECLVILVTPGGDPDAAYKMARYLQSRYNSYKVLVSGMCKSAGTLFAIGADELIFAPYGELGPLDIQLSKTDNLTGMESGLNISEAFNTLETRAKGTFVDVILELISSSGGVVSFQTASHAAAEVVSAFYGPVFARIDPEEVGSRSRAMRIGADYGDRLNLKWNNLKSEALVLLSETYSSHGFVIDSLEAQELFNRVRMANTKEMELVRQLGVMARHPHRELTIRKLNNTGIPKESETGHEEPNSDNGSEEAREHFNEHNIEETITVESAPTSQTESSRVTKQPRNRT